MMVGVYFLVFVFTRGDVSTDLGHTAGGLGACLGFTLWSFRVFLG